MTRVRRGRKRWRTKWPWKKLFPLVVDERFCRECQLPYHNGPLPKAIEQFLSGNVGALIYPAGNWNRQSLAVRFGKWKSQSRESFYLSEYFLTEDLEDLLLVAAQAREYLSQRTQKKSAKR